MNKDTPSFPLFFPRARPEIEELEPYQAPLEGRRKFLRLDFNENTLGPSPLVVDALKKIKANEISIYPEYDGLREVVVANLMKKGLKLPIKPEQIGIFNGVDAAINAVFHSYGERGDKLLTTTPTFGYYSPCAHMRGMEIHSVPYEHEKFRFPYETIQQYLLEMRPRILLICNPNNPTGTRLSPEKIIELATNAPETLVVVDELYEAFTGDSVLPLIDFSSISNVLILRSLAKTSGLAGLRIGFAIGVNEVVNRVSRVTGPYDVNSFAVTAAFAALSDQAYVDAYVGKVLDARKWIHNQLIASGLRFHLDGGNYFLLWPEKSAGDVASSLKQLGVLVREMKVNSPLEGSLRVSIGTRTQMRKFWDAFLKI